MTCKYYMESRMKRQIQWLWTFCAVTAVISFVYVTLTKVKRNSFAFMWFALPAL